MLVNRTSCSQCNARLGLQWLFAAVAYVAIFVTFFLATRWLLDRFQPTVAGAVLFSMFLIVGGTAAKLGPLKVKSKRQAP